MYKRLVLSHAAATQQALVAAVASSIIRVLALAVYAAGDVTVVFQSADTALTGVMTLSKTGSFISVPLLALGGGTNFAPLVQTASGEALNWTLGGAVQCSGWMLYDVLADAMN